MESNTILYILQGVILLNVAAHVFNHRRLIRQLITQILGGES